MNNSYRDCVKSRLQVSPDRSILSVDLEEYYSVIPDADVVLDQVPVPKRAHVTLPRLLDLLDECSVRATFFVLASVVDHIAPVLERIVKSNHEIACHGWSHTRVHQLTSDEFRKDVVRSRDRIEAATGIRPRGYRAPSFSMAQKTIWAFDILKDEGFEYDSSVVPLNNFYYGGLPHAPQWPHQLNNGLFEFPLPVYKVGPLGTLIGGGFYLRVFPPWLNRYFLWRYRVRNNCPDVIYIHPWDYDEARFNAWEVGAEHPELDENRRLIKWVNTYNRKGAWSRFESLLKSRKWTCFRDLLSTNTMIESSTGLL